MSLVRRSAAGALALALAACGCGGKSSHDIATIRSVGAAPSSGGAGPSRTEKQTGQRAKIPGEAGTGIKTPAGASRRSAGRKLTPARRRDAAAHTAAAILTELGLPIAAISVTSEAQTMAIAIPKRAACTATRADEPRIRQVVRTLVPFVRIIRVAVATTDQTLGGYVAAHCQPPQIPGGPGRVVFSRNGVGQLTTAPITITARRWTIAYSSQALLLKVTVKDRDGRGNHVGSPGTELEFAL